MLIFQLLELLIVTFVLFGLLYIALKGAPYAVTSPKRVKVLVSLLGVKKGERAIDLGSGDGRIVVALARAGAITDGYEINPVLVWLSRRNIRKAGFEKSATIYWKSFWHADFSRYKLVTIFGSPHIMGAVEKKIELEMQKGSRIGSISFRFPHWKTLKEHERVLLYTV